MIRASDRRFDDVLLRQAFGCFPSGVTAFCGMLGGVPEGMAASSFTSVSLDPALVSVCVANTSSTWPRLPPQLAWVTRITRSVTISETTATWPRLMRPLGRKARTDPVCGRSPVAYLPLAWPHQVRASP